MGKYYLSFESVPEWLHNKLNGTGLVQPFDYEESRFGREKKIKKKTKKYKLDGKVKCENVKVMNYPNPNYLIF